MIAASGAPNCRRILVGVDFSESTPGVLELAAAVARAFGGKLEILHVLVLNESDTVTAESELARCVPPQMADLVSGRRMARALSADLGLLTAARETGADLVVLGTHGRSGLSHVMLGSVAERVVQLAECPVLTVRRPGHEFKRP